MYNSKLALTNHNKKEKFIGKLFAKICRLVKRYVTYTVNLNHGTFYIERLSLEVLATDNSNNNVDITTL